MTSLINDVYPLIQKEVQPEVRIGALVAMLEVEKQQYNFDMTLSMIQQQLVKE
jgi:hypothetical protein